MVEVVAQDLCLAILKLLERAVLMEEMEEIVELEEKMEQTQLDGQMYYQIILDY